MDFKVISVVAFCCLAIAAAVPSVDDSPSQNSIHVNENTSVEEQLLKKLNSKCTNRDVSSCMMMKFVAYFNKLLSKSQFAMGDFEITQTSSESSMEHNARSFDEVSKMSEEEQFLTVLTDKAVNFIRTRSLRWKLMDEAEVVISGKDDKDGRLSFGLSLRQTPSGAGDARKKKDNGMGALIAAAALKIGLLKALAFKALVMLVGKALLVSKLALVLAAVIGLKKLFSQEKHVTYEVVAHPHHESHHEHSVSGGHDSYSGGWGRNYDAASLAYRAHTPKVQPQP